MCFDNVFNLLPVCLGFVQILLNIALRINDRRFAVRTDVIRSVCQTAQIKLFEFHNLTSQNKFLYVKKNATAKTKKAKDFCRFSTENLCERIVPTIAPETAKAVTKNVICKSNIP